MISIAELASEIEKENENLNTLMKGLLIYEESFKRSWDIIKDVIEMTKGRQACMNGRKLISSFPTDFIEQYQTIHSVIPPFPDFSLCCVMLLFDG